MISTFEEYARLQKQRPQSNAHDGAEICYAEGIVAKLRGEYDTALALFNHALAMFETLFEGEHHETIASIHVRTTNLAVYIFWLIYLHT